MNAVMYLIANTSVEMSKGKFGAQAGHAAVEAYRLSVSLSRPCPVGCTPGSAVDPESEGVPSPCRVCKGTAFVGRASTLVQEWLKGGHYTKIVLAAEDLAVAERYLNDRDIRTVLIIDEGRTEFDGNLTPTFIGCAIVDKDDPEIAAVFSAFKLYKEPKRQEPVVEAPAALLTKWLTRIWSYKR